jgi:hypothetical protein
MADECRAVCGIVSNLILLTLAFGVALSSCLEDPGQLDSNGLQTGTAIDRCIRLYVGIRAGSP